MIKVGDKVEIIDTSDRANMTVQEFGNRSLYFRKGAIVTVYGLQSGFVKILVGTNAPGGKRTNVLRVDRIRVV